MRLQLYNSFSFLRRNRSHPKNNLLPKQKQTSVAPPTLYPITLSDPIHLNPKPHQQNPPPL